MKTFVTIPPLVRLTLGDEASDALAEEVNRVLDQMSNHTSEAVVGRLLPEIKLILADRLDPKVEDLHKDIQAVRTEVMTELRERFDRVDVGFQASRLHVEDQIKDLRKDVVANRMDLLKEFTKQLTGTVLVTMLVAISGTIFITFVLKWLFKP